MEIRDTLRALADEKRTYPQRRGEAVEAARAEGMTWREIAQLLEVTEDAVTMLHRKWRAEQPK